MFQAIYGYNLRQLAPILSIGAVEKPLIIEHYYALPLDTFFKCFFRSSSTAKTFINWRCQQTSSRNIFNQQKLALYQVHYKGLSAVAEAKEA
jgi:hypothetical protein